MKNLFLIFGSLFFLTLNSCNLNDIEEFEEVKTLKSIEETAKYHWSHVNPTGIDYELWQAAAFCGDGYSNQIQIWTSDYSNCVCMLDQFISECNEEITSLTPCFKTSSKYPPLSDLCSK